MIQAFHELGRALDTDPAYKAYFASYADPFAGYDGVKVVWYFEIKDDVVSDRIQSIDYRSEDAWKYLYRKPRGSNGAPLVATGPLYPSTDLSEEKKRQAHQESMEKVMGRIQRTIPQDGGVYFSSRAARDTGLEQVERLLLEKAGTRDERYIYTFRINGKWPGEIEELVKLLDSEAYAKYYEKSQAEDKTCALTHESETTVWGRVDTLGFTVNDQAFARSGFDPGYSYRMFPVSPKAVKALEAAKRFAFTHLNDRLWPMEYVVLPRLLEGTPNELMSIINEQKQAIERDRIERIGSALFEAESIFDFIAEETDLRDKSGLLFDFLFYERNQAQLALLLHLQEVSPLRIKEVSDTQKKAERRYRDVFATGKMKDIKSFKFSLVTVKRFFMEGFGTKQRQHPFFMRILEGIFYGEPVEEKIVLATFMAKIRQTFKERHDNNFWPGQVKGAIVSWHYLSAIGLFGQSLKQKSSLMEPLNTGDLDYKQFFQQHANYYDRSPALKGAFLLGMLTGMLSRAQYAALESTPFYGKLNNLSLDTKELRRLAPKLLDKIKQYQDQKKTSKMLQFDRVNDLAANALQHLHDDQGASRDELSFAFASGMVVQQQYSRQIALERAAAKEANTSQKGQ